MYVYINSEPGLWTVGYYEPNGNWFAESDHGSAQLAADRVHWLNGGRQVPEPEPEPEPVFPYKCPDCGERERLVVYPVVPVELNAITGEIDKDTGDTHWENDDRMLCQECNFEGMVKEFV